MTCQTIDEVLARLNEIVDVCKKEQNPAGYFAVLYRKVTQEVKKGIEQNQFEDNARMEKLDVHFANRYIDAFTIYRHGGIPTASWKTAFDTKSGMIMQHILLGINAHINLDLGIASVSAASPYPLHSLENDFNAINNVLGSLVERVKTNIGSVSPLFKWLMPMAKKMDEMLILFSIKTARTGAWQFANTLEQNAENSGIIAARDNSVAMIGRKLVQPGKVLSLLAISIAAGEWRSVANAITIMEKNFDLK